MATPVTRRAAATLGTILAAAAITGTAAAGTGNATSPGLAAEFARLEAVGGGRLGVAVLDTATGARHGHRADERFPLCSTFKLLAAGAVLARVDAGHETLDRRVRFTPAELVPYSPVTRDHVGGDGMTLAGLCEAALTRSDNTAGNLLLGAIGGPAGLTGFARSLGDSATRLDRTETALNEALPGDPRDTTTPASMLADLHALVLGEALFPASRARLTGWLLANRTGDTRLRAGLPEGWRVADKTGAGERGTNNDIGVLWPPGRAPVLVCAYVTGSTAPAETVNAAIAGVARAVAAAIAG